MSDEIEIPPVKKYRGAFIYKQNGSQYAEESFDAYLYVKDRRLEFKSIITSRVKTGELLKIDVHYMVNKDWVTTYVEIKKSLGKSLSIETFENDLRRNTLSYKHENHLGVVTKESLSVPPRLHIGTPATCSSFLYLNSKKIDINGKNNFSIYTTQNGWDFEAPPEQTTVALMRDKPTTEEIKIGRANLTASLYLMELMSNIDEPPSKALENKEKINVYISKHSTIPYLIQDNKNNLTIEVKYLNDLDPDL